MGQLPPSPVTEEHVAVEPQAPHVFVRTFTVPTGMPWDQGKAAQLEVRHGAPLPITDLMHRLRRLGGWSPGQPGRFAAFYVRRSDYTAPFETTVDVDGREIRLAFGTSGDQLQRVKLLALATALLIVSALVMVWATTSVLAARSEAADRLDVLERSTAAKLRAAHRLRQVRDQNLRLAQAQQGAGLASDVIDDLTWLAHAKAPDARIVAVHWDHGLLAVEARGDASPVHSLERPIIKDTKPVRPGVWLWGIAKTAQAGGPLTSAKLRDAR